jgi:hypothetical protein
MKPHEVRVTVTLSSHPPQDMPPNQEPRRTIPETGSGRPVSWNLLLRVMLVTGFLTGSIHAMTWQAVPSGEVAGLNPLAGFVPFDGQYHTFPYAMEYFYLPVNQVQTDYETFDWTALEAKLQSIANRGHHAIFRLFYDYPDRASGIPGFLSHVPTRSYTAHNNGNEFTSVSPDYEHPDFKRAMLNLIAALGARYDGDPRIGFLQLGLVGFWGEWHTWPHEDWMPSVTTRNAIIAAFDAAFSHTRLVIREPRGISPSTDIGYHDDSFVYNTYGDVSWYHYPKLTTAGETEKWRHAPMGGELRPEIQTTIWETDALEAQPPGGPVQNWNTSVALTHASWMLVWKTFWPGLDGAAKTRALHAAQGLGYALRILSWGFSDEGEGLIRLGLRLQNIGVAPFYYPWAFEFGLFSGGELRHTVAPADWDVRTVVDAGWITFEHAAQEPLSPGTCTLAVRLRNPLAGGLPVIFANENPNPPDPSWQVLGTVTINHPPELQAIGSRMIRAGESLSIQVQAADPDHDSLRYSASAE